MRKNLFHFQTKLLFSSCFLTASVSLFRHAPPIFHMEESQPIDAAVKDQWQILSPSIHTLRWKKKGEILQLFPHPHFLNFYLLYAAVSSLNTFLNAIFASNNKPSATILIRTYFRSSYTLILTLATHLKWNTEGLVIFFLF